MKNKIILSLLAFTSAFGYSQVIIGDEVGTATDKTSVLLEFSKGENRGIILPYITSLPTNPTEGTIILDATNSSDAKVKYYNGSWIALSQDSGEVRGHLSQQPNEKSNVGKVGTIIGASSTTAEGILVLESTDKAMVLPMVSSTDEVVNPSPGMMVYVSNAKNKLLAVFNGSNWSFWSSND